MARKSRFPTPAAVRAALAIWAKGGMTIGQVRRKSGIRGTVLIGAILVSGTPAQVGAIHNNGKRAQAPTANAKTAAKRTRRATRAPAAAATPAEAPTATTASE